MRRGLPLIDNLRRIRRTYNPGRIRPGLTPVAYTPHVTPDEIAGGIPLYHHPGACARDDTPAYLGGGIPSLNSVVHVDTELVLVNTFIVILLSLLTCAYLGAGACCVS